MRVVVINPPGEILSLGEVKDHLSVDHDDDDTIIAGMRDAVVAHLDAPDGWLGRAIGEQVLEARFDTFEAWDTLQLPFPPVIELVSIKWSAPDRTIRTGNLADVELLGAVVVPIGGAPWSGGRAGREALQVRYRAGYAEVPPQIRSAMLLMIGDLYQNRETVRGGAATEIPMSTTVERLLNPLRIWA